VDEVRPARASEAKCWDVVKRVAFVLQYMGVQDTARKRRPPSQTPGAWLRAVIWVMDDGAGISIYMDKWEKTRIIIARIMQLLEESRVFDHKQLEQNRGFLDYVTRTCTPMRPTTVLHHVGKL
jgi:hypothetical protein